MLNKSNLLILLVICSSMVFGQGIIIDHNCKDISLIPESVIDDIQQNIRFEWAHTSHGGQINCGLMQIDTLYPAFNVEIGDMVLPEVPDALCIYDGIEGYFAPGSCCQYVGPDKYWETPEGIQWVIETLTHNPSINVSAWSWCTELDTYTEEQVQQYLEQMTEFESMFPNVTFIYFTGNAQADGDVGYNRHLRNDQIRQYCFENNKILFDFEDIDCWYNGEFHYYLYGNDTIPIQHDAYNGDACGHVNYLSAEQKGRAIWWMMARLRGWEPSITLNLKVFLQGVYQSGEMNTILNISGQIPLEQPFNEAPWNYNGGEWVSAIPGSYIVDWILLDFRAASEPALATGSTCIYRQAVFLTQDGTIVNINGSPDIQAGLVSGEQLYVVIHHRNHLSIISSLPLQETDGSYNYDFSDLPGKAYGPNAQIYLDNGIYGMKCGDCNADGIVNNLDRQNAWESDAGSSGYNKADVNLDGEVNNVDMNDYWLPNIESVTQVPQ
ncbi:MAG: hypothetical protein JW731_07375 [Bacteroidales bacterium]|nr:hypothetical protein [Bacteroidales bacterium]